MRLSTPLSLITMAILSPTYSYAEANTAQGIEKILVTASRTAKANTDLALSSSSVEEDVIVQDNSQHLSESLETISGVLVNQLSGGQGHNAAIRMPINYGGYTLYLQDNIPLQSAAFYNHNALWWASSNSSLSRLEVIKGAGTSLYGSGAVAATVNVISAPVSANKNELTATLSENNYQKYNASFTNQFNDNNGVRISGAYLKNDGWRDHSAIEKSEVNVLHEVDLKGSHSLKTSIVASTLEQQMLSSLNDEQFAEDPTQSGLPAEVEAIDPKRKTDYLRVSSEYQYQYDALYLSVIPYYRYRSNNYTATWQPNMPSVESNVNTIGALALVNFLHHSDYETTFGIDLERSEGDAYSYQPTTRTTTGWGAATYPEGHVFYNDKTLFTGISPYIQHIGSLTSALNYSVGLRFDHNKYEFDNNLPVYDDDGFGNRSIENRSDSYSHLSPKASVNYKLNEQSSVYFRFANAIRIPTASELYHLKTKETSAQLSELKEETSDTYEVGYKANFDKLSIEAAYYLMNVDDAIVTAYDDFGASYRVNAAKVDHSGVELGVQYQASDIISFAFAFSRSRHKFDHYIQDEGRVDYRTKLSREVDLSGNHLQMAPEYVANFRVNYNDVLVDNLRWIFELKSIGDYWMDAENSRKYSGYSIVNIKASLAISDKLKAHLRVANATDKKYALQSEIRYGSTRIQAGAPRTIYAGLSYQF